MRYSHFFGHTLRETPSDSEVISHQLLLRAGFIRQLGTGIFSYLPLARRSLTKIENIIREEMNAIGGLEITMPVIHPADLWKETGRWFEIGAEMGRFRDRADRDMVLAMTHEEVVADLVRKEVKSYRQLPLLIYHLQTKWRDDPRPRAGLIRVREFTMKDSYSMDVDEEGLDRQYRAHYQAYFNIFNRCALPTVAVASDVGMMGGSMAHEFMYLTPIGEDTLLLCDVCGYHANRQIARFKKPDPEMEPQKPLEKVATPDAATIAQVSEFLNVPKAKTAKAVFFIATLMEQTAEVQRLVFAVVRGDMELNESKLSHAVKAKELRPAHEEEIAAAGAVPGYASPIGLAGVIVVVDDLVAKSPNLVTGANEAGFHYTNSNYGRDYKDAIVSDIVSAEAGSPCPECGSPMRSSRGVETGNIFKLGTRYSASLGCTYLDADGSSKFILMGSYGIGVGRLLACIAEEHNDDKGLIWPATVAPYQIHLVHLPGEGTVSTAEQIYQQLNNAGLETLYDDRDERAGVKFKDADLIGIPVRVTISDRSLKSGGAEVMLRGTRETEVVGLNQLQRRLSEKLNALRSHIQSGVVTVPFQS